MRWKARSLNPIFRCYQISCKVVSTVMNLALRDLRAPEESYPGSLEGIVPKIISSDSLSYDEATGEIQSILRFLPVMERSPYWTICNKTGIPYERVCMLAMGSSDVHVMCISTGRNVLYDRRVRS